MRTAVAAPDAFEDLFEAIDTLTVLELLGFTNRMRDRFRIKKLPHDVPLHERHPNLYDEHDQYIGPLA